MVHEKIKPFACEVPGCNFTAGARKGLQIHVDSVHLKLKKAACPYCEYKAAYTSVLNSHIRDSEIREI